MGNAAAVALSHMTDGQSMPVSAPNGTAKCPGGVVRIGVFFDGTDNNMYSDAPRDLPQYSADPMSLNGRSNVAKLWTLYIEQGTLQKRIYCHGVGTDEFQQTYRNQQKAARGTPARATGAQAENEARADAALGPTEVHGHMAGAGFGAGGRSRIEWGRMQLSDFYSNFGNDIAITKLYDTYGFSRGAALARDFVNKVRTLGIDNLKKPNGYRMQGRRRINIYERHHPPTPTFLGVWDTVGSFGGGGLQWADAANDYDFFVDHTHVKKTVHLIAEDEIRGNFPVTSLFMDPDTRATRGSGGYQQPSAYKDTLLEMWYPGAHCDVGGSYTLRHETPAVPEERRVSSTRAGRTVRVIPGKPAQPGKRPDLAHIPLRDMHQASLKAKVPLNPDLSACGPAKIWAIPGDLQQWYSAYDDYRQPRPYGIEKRYIHTFPETPFRQMFYQERILQPNFELLKLHFIHDSAAEFMMSWIDGMRWQRTVLYMARQPAAAAPSVR
jgi:hypothetical protein